VLKNRDTNTELFVVIFQLIPTEEAKKDGVKDPEDQVEEIHGDDKEVGKGNEDLD
jgi:hypothetical protein